MHEFFKADQVYHVVSHDRVFHVVALRGPERFVGWCLEFPNLTASAENEAAVVEKLTDEIDAVYREGGWPD